MIHYLWDLLTTVPAKTYFIKCLGCSEVVEQPLYKQPEEWIGIFEIYESFFGTCQNCISPYTSNGLKPIAYNLNPKTYPKIVEDGFTAINCALCERQEYTNLLTFNKLIEKMDSDLALRHNQELYSKPILHGWEQIQCRLEGDFIGRCSECEPCRECRDASCAKCNGKGWVSKYQY